MAEGERRALGELMGVKMRLLGDSTPLLVEKDKGSESVGVGRFEDSGETWSAVAWHIVAA